MCSLIYLNLYNLMLNNLVNRGLNFKSEDSDDDTLVDYKNLMSLLYSKMDPSIRIKLNKPGLSVIQNIYTGFDTEYKHLEKICNELISVQLAVNTRTFLKIPMISDYFTCKIDVLSSKLLPIKRVEGFRYDLFEANVVDCIRQIRYINCRKYDVIMQILCTRFKELCDSNPKKFSYFVKGDYLVVSLPRTPVEKYVYLNDKKVGYTFEDVLNVANNLGNKYLDEDYSKIRYILNNLKKFYEEG